MKALMYCSAGEYIYDTTSWSLIILQYVIFAHNLKTIFFFPCISTASINCACKPKRLMLVAFTVYNTSVCKPVSPSGAADAV